MAIKAKAEITIFNVKDVKSVTRYYLLQSSTAATPAKPTTITPGGNWKTAEPSYTDGSTNTLYFVDLTIMSDGKTFSYSDVSKSSSYEAAKAAWNKANNAQKTANGIADNIYAPGTIQIDGGKIKADSVTAKQINIEDLFAQTIKATGTIEGATIVTESGKIGGWSITQDDMRTDKLIDIQKYYAAAGDTITEKYIFTPRSISFGYSAAMLNNSIHAFLKVTCGLPADDGNTAASEPMYDKLIIGVDGSIGVVGKYVKDGNLTYPISSIITDEDGIHVYKHSVADGKVVTEEVFTAASEITTILNALIKDLQATTMRIVDGWGISKSRIQSQQGASIGAAKAGIFIIDEDGKPYVIAQNAGGTSVFSLDRDGKVAAVAFQGATLPSSNYIKGRDVALFRSPKTVSDTQYHPYASYKTKNASWDVATYGNTFGDCLAFSQISDANYSANNNVVTGATSYLSPNIGMALNGTGKWGTITRDTTNTTAMSEANLTRIGNMVQCYFTVTVKNAQSAGDVANVKIASVPTGYKPVSKMSLCSGENGPVASAVITANGDIYLAAMATAIKAGTKLSFGGTWLTANLLTS